MRLSTGEIHHWAKHRQRHHNTTQHTHFYEQYRKRKTKVYVNEGKVYSKILVKMKAEDTFSQTPTGHLTLHYTKS